MRVVGLDTAAVLWRTTRRPRFPNGVARCCSTNTRSSSLSVQERNATRHAVVTVSEPGKTTAPTRIVTAHAPFSLGDVHVTLKERTLTVVGARW